jgi:hypothetical protein
MSALSETSSDSSVCENIGPRQRAKRVRFGVVFGAIGLGLVAALLETHAGRAWRLTAFLPFVMAGISLFQVRERTCVAFAARGIRDMDDGEQPVTNPAELKQIALQSRRVYTQALITAAALTLLLLLLP